MSNIIPSGYVDKNEALKIANQIFKTTFLFKNRSNVWKIIMVNDPQKLRADIKSIDFGSKYSLVVINDRMGNIKRKVCKINSNTLITIAKIMEKYDKNNNVVTNNQDLFRERISNYKKQYDNLENNKTVPEKEKSEEVVIPKKNIEGPQNLKPTELFCYFKKELFNDLSLEKIIKDGNALNLILHIKLNDKKLLEVVEPRIRMSNKKELFNNALDKVSNKNYITVKLDLKNRFLKRLKEQIIENESADDTMAIIGPLRKPVLTDLNNFDLSDIIFS